ncbi:hypothetical protein GCM10010116_53380 [Microbispora rosea subsp. aerata]|nr:DUF488 domain-containing protein [Microbispora rosea]GGO26595.1 hypothetical protein GCM10010116_53380 [Microbispora rosea subsp. aerata]GIH58375.1 hypothetical protein Mro02_52890 [Microbispora rosea subsp. aerata]GLJ84052.1 hypothetical protein GCM10017588_27800 [Microbispora rosea subsp. aerata]
MSGQTPGNAAGGENAARVTLLTFGHGTAPREHLIPLLRGAGVREVVDVRTAPGSRRNPDAGRAALESWLPEAGIGYRWDRRLGGFRRAAPDSPDVFWENASFRGYAGYSRHPGFLAAMDDLLAQARAARTAVMCAEAVWWRCHRRIIADFAVLVRGARVLHLSHEGSLSEHAPTSGARLRDDGLLVYDRL